MFSTRVPRDLAANRLTIAVAAQRAAGRPLIDLTESNPTRAGIAYPLDAMSEVMSRAALGHLEALYRATSAQRSTTR